MRCPFCPPALETQQIVFETDLSIFLQQEEPVLAGSGIIIPKAHRPTVFDLTAAEWANAFQLLQQVKAALDGQYAPDGYNIGWNSGLTAGQEIFHAHMHVIPRFRDEPLAGKGIRYWLKQETNQRLQKLAG